MSGVRFTPLGAAGAAGPAVTQVEKRVDVAIAKADAKRQIAYGCVLAPCGPDDPDSQGDWYDAESIELAAHGFLKAAVAGEAWGDVMHDEVSKAGVPVESYVAPVDFTWPNGELVKAGSWVMGMHYADPEVWGRIEKGELAAFSVGGRGTRIFEEG